MFVSINHIPVAEGRETDFEKLWQQRERTVEKQPGFLSLDVLGPGVKMRMGQKPEKVDNVYHVLTRWESETDFHAWVGSDDFKKAHGRQTDKSIFAGPSFVTLHPVVESADADPERSG